MKNILLLGDSLTAGYRLNNPQSESVPGLIQLEIDRLHLDFKVHNAGVSGCTSAGGLARLPGLLSQPIDIFILELGINDLIRKIMPATTQANLEKIVQAVLFKNPSCKLALMGMRLPGHIKSTATLAFNNIYPALAAKYAMAYVPFYLDGVAGKPALNLPDHVHPNAAGYRVIAGKIWPVIQLLLI